jgi:DNA-binding response OmpR family regulator
MDLGSEDHMQKNLLIVEQNPKLAQIIKQKLKSHFCKIVLAFNLNQANQSFQKNDFYLTIVGQNFNDGSGLDLIKFINQEYPLTQSIFYSHQDQLHDRINCFNLGADDFVSKNSNLDELIFKTQLLANKVKLIPKLKISAGKFTLHLQTGLLQICNQQLKLNPKETKLMECLLYHFNQTITTQTLTNWTWGYSGQKPHGKTFRVQVSNLRNKLGKHNSHLRTVRGFGYRLAS